MSNPEIKNAKARFNYEILETFEAGLVLQGNEVKSIRTGKVNLAESFISTRDQEVWLHNMTIQPYDKARVWQPSPTRTRKLLLHKIEINRLMGRVREKGLTLVPLKLYFKKQRVKLLLGLGKGKKTVDKRETIKRRELDREMRRIVKTQR